MSVHQSGQHTAVPCAGIGIGGAGEAGEPTLVPMKVALVPRYEVRQCMLATHFY